MNLPQTTCPRVAARCRAFLRTLWAAVLVAAASVPVAGGESGDKPDLESKLNQKGSIVLKDAPLTDWILAIKEEWHINIVAGGELQRETVSGAFSDTTLREVLSAILFARGYGYQPVGDSLLILRLEDMGPIQPQYEIALVPLEYLSATEAEPTARLLLSKGGTAQAVPSSKSLMIVDLPDRVAKIKEHLRVLEEQARTAAEKQPETPPTTESAAPSPGAVGPAEPMAEPERVEVFPVQFVSVDTLVTLLQSVVGTEGRVSALQQENRLVVVGTEQTIQNASAIVRQVDVPKAQVRISAVLYDVTLEAMEKLGVNWSHALKGRINAAGDPQSLLELNTNFAQGGSAAPATDTGTGTGTDTATDAPSTAAAVATGGLWTISNLSKHFDLGVFIAALDQTDGARLLARPSVIAYDRTPADIKIISEIPVQQLTQTGMGGSIGTTEFREAGITLSVTPNILSDNTVLLDLTPEFSVLSGFSPEGQPIIDRRNTKTKVRLQDGQTLIIGGLLRRNELESVQGVPGLMNWKFLGRLFRYHDTTVTDSELLIFIKAEIVLPDYEGLPREQIAAAVAQERLEQIPYATNSPFIPPCRDPHCPYHCPRGPVPPDVVCSQCKHHFWQGPPYPPPAPTYGEPTSMGPEADSPEVVPAPEIAPTPPPVLLDEARRMPSPGAIFAMRRLPPVGDRPAGTRPAAPQADVEHVAQPPQPQRDGALRR